MILSWYRQNASDFGFVRSTRLLLSVVWRRALVQTCNSLFAEKVECPCCGWTGNRFLDYLEMGYTVSHTECPGCGSHSRHRGLFVWLKNEYGIERHCGPALVFAPERALSAIWSVNHNLRVVRIDIQSGRGVDLLADIMHLPLISDLAEVIWCHHVLEQVKDDRLALRELHRVLKLQTGRLILSAGSGNEYLTREFCEPNKELSGSRRAYGGDLIVRLQQAGFVVERMNYGLTDEQLMKYQVIDEPFYVCLKG